MARSRSHHLTNVRQAGNPVMTRLPAITPDHSHRHRVWWWLGAIFAITLVAVWIPVLWFFVSFCWFCFIMFWLFISGNAMDDPNDDNFIDHIF